MITLDHDQLLTTHILDPMSSLLNWIISFCQGDHQPSVHPVRHKGLASYRDDDDYDGWTNDDHAPMTLRQLWAVNDRITVTGFLYQPIPPYSTPLNQCHHHHHHHHLPQLFTKRNPKKLQSNWNQVSTIAFVWCPAPSNQQIVIIMCRTWTNLKKRKQIRNRSQKNTNTMCEKYRNQCDGCIWMQWTIGLKGQFVMTKWKIWFECWNNCGTQGLSLNRKVYNRKIPAHMYICTWYI